MRAELGIWTPNEELHSLIEQRGGPVNCHEHFDRAYTASLDGYERMGDASLTQKWELIDELKKLGGYKDTLRPRMDMRIVHLREQGCNACRTYIDADSTIGLFAIETALLVKEEWERRGFFLQVAASPVKGITHAEDRVIFLEACDLVDVVGGLPSRSRLDVSDIESSRQSMHELFEIAARFSKPIDMQIDQANHPYEIELKALIEVSRYYRTQGYIQSITAVHCISSSAWHMASERDRCFEEMRELEISVVVCPGAALGMYQHRDVEVPTHNSIAPIPQLLEAGVNVAFGVDNVEDLYMPFTTGDIYEEMREMLRAIRWQGPLELIADIMTVNGRKVLGI